MGWVESQIEERRKADLNMLEDAFAAVAGVVLDERSAQTLSDRRIVTEHVIDEILKYYHETHVEPDENITDPEEQLDYCLRPSGLMRREVVLDEGWYHDSFGPLIAFTKDEGLPVALLPGMLGYSYRDPKTGKTERINQHWKDHFTPDAYCFYRPLPQRPIGVTDLLIYMKGCVNTNDIILTLGLTLVCTSAGMLIPRITRALTGPILNYSEIGALGGAAVTLFSIALAIRLLESIRSLINARIGTKTSLGVQASMMMRLLSLPPSFFRGYSAGELKSRSVSVSTLCSLMMDIVLGTGLSAIVSLLYIGQIFRFSRALVLPSLLMVAASAGFSALTTFASISIRSKHMELSAKESGMSYAMISGIQKIRLTGSERRIFARWLKLYSESAELTYNPPAFIKLNTVISTAIGLISSIVIYFIALSNQLDQSTYLAFMAAYGALAGAFTMLSSVALKAAEIRPILQMAEPFLKAAPETAGTREMINGIRGGIELEHVSFRYDKEQNYILKDISLKVKPGEYVAIVGRTGCGKSTLMRLLLGFEVPEHGSVFYDGRDLAMLDLQSLRRCIGTVMQDAGLFPGDIYSNIVISAPHLTVADAWEAAETAGIADDIRNLPMGMSTLISEGQGGFSGGQKQRLMIARAIVGKPKVLLFDEATSALDNVTQKKVTDALEKMKCTRIVIGHRLSTIRHCDRILMLDEGRIAEQGTYEELIALNGKFAEMIRRQRLDEEEKNSKDG